MPCDTVQTSRVDLGKVLPDVLAGALTAAGWSSVKVHGSGADVCITAYSPGGVSLYWVPGECQLSSRNSFDLQAETAGVKRAYSSELVKRQAARFGWRVSVGVGGELVLQR